MKKIFGSDAIHMLPLPSGFIIAVKQNEYDDHIVVAYKMATTETDVINSVTRNVYLLAKFGNNFKQYEELFKDYINCKTISLSGGKMLIVYPDGRAFKYDSAMQPEWVGELKYKDLGPADIARHKNCVWASFPESNTIIRYNLESMREELRIGGSSGSAFSYPLGLWVVQDSLLVSSADSHKIIEVDLGNFSAYDYAEFEEPVKQYIKIGKTEIVQLESGIYIL